MLVSFIDGQEVCETGGPDLPIVDPSTGEIATRISAASSADVDRAVAAARRTLREWSSHPPVYRKQVLRSLADLIDANNDRLDVLDAREMGKPVSLKVGNAASAAGLLRFFAEAIDKLSGEVFTSDHKGVAFQRHFPRGVVGAITPWNFPTLNAIRKIAPALAAGNTVVLKPSELASSSAVAVARLAIEAGLEPGVLNVVTGTGILAGNAIGIHTDVDMLTFTGSTVVGKSLLAAAASSNMKPALVECGGKSPHIVFDDGVDLDQVAASIANGILTNQGQVCSAGSRVIVQRGIANALTLKIAEICASIRIGSAVAPNTEFGPIVSFKQKQRISDYIGRGIKDGSRIILESPASVESLPGSFLGPTILADVPPDSRAAQEEIFGPVLTIFSFETIDQAVTLANGTDYGLFAYVWTASLSTALRMSSEVRSSVRVSTGQPLGDGGGHSASSEPVGLSGVGIESGLAGLQSYLHRKLIQLNGY